MRWPIWLVCFLGALLGCWLLFDGVRAFATGDFVTPASGPHAGELGPWSMVLEAMGIAPRSALAKGLHGALGTLWVGSLCGLVGGTRWAWWTLVACAALSLWYLPLGTLVALAELGLLLLLRARP